MRVSFSLSLIAVFLASSAAVSGWSLPASEHAVKRHHHAGRSGGMVKTYVKRGDAGKPKQCSPNKADKPRPDDYASTPAVSRQASSGVRSTGDDKKHSAESRQSDGDTSTPGFSTPTSSTPGYGSGTSGDNSSDGNVVHAQGMMSSSHAPLDSSINPRWFDPSLVYHGPGTTFGGGNNFWQGGACMLDDLPHANLPSVAMDQTYWQDGLACGTCVEIASTSAAEFSNSAVWKVEQPVAGELAQTKKTVAIVSDLCPGVGQCFSGLDMHPDTWSSVTDGANGSKLPIHWRFVSCKEAFKSSGSGGKSLQVHWRSGANPGFCQVQIRGAYEAVVKVEAKVGNGEWMSGKHVDSSFWSFENKANTIDEHTDFVFRLTDWKGSAITTEVATQMGRDVLISSNF